MSKSKTISDGRRDLTQGSLAGNLFHLAVPMMARMGSGHTRPVFVLSVLRQWLLRIPFAWILGYGLGYGSSGIYGGLVASNLISAAMTFYVFKLGNWQKAVIDPHQAKEDLHETAAIDDT